MEAALVQDHRTGRAHTMRDILTTAQIEDFRRDGFLVVGALLSVPAVQRCLEDLAAFLGRDQLASVGVNPKHIVREADNIGVKYAESVDHYVPSIKSLLNLKLLTAAGQLLGQNTHFWAVEMHDKVPHHGTVTPPHQDNFYFCLDPPDALTVYVPLEPHGHGNGGLCYVRGSHKLGTLEHGKSKVKAFSSELLGGARGEDHVFPIEMQPGDVVFHHANTVHFAPRNPSDNHRRSLSIRVNGERAAVSESMRQRYLVNKSFNREDQTTQA
jgi:phytanoyl-CoA hydroxylase